MATERIDIIVTDRGTRTVRRNIEAIGGSAGIAQRSLGGLQNALNALAGSLVVRKLLQLADSYTTIQNQVRIATNSTEQLVLVTEELFTIANKTRAPIRELTALYQKGSIASKELGASQQELLNFVETVGLALGQQTGNVQAVQGALLQLSQALGSGTVRAEEFNSILEGAFPIAVAAANGLDRAGGSVARLRQLVLAGEVSSEDFFRALLSQQSELQTIFNKTNSTVRQAFITLDNALVKAIGQFDQANGITRTFAAVLNSLANNIGTVLRVFSAAAITIGVIFAKNAVGAAIAAVRTLTLVIAANPLGALLLAITAVVSLLITFSDRIKLGGDSLATLGDLAPVVWESIKGGLKDLVSFFERNFGFIGRFASETFSNVELSISGVLKTAAVFADQIVGAYIGAFNAIVAFWSNLPKAFVDIFTRALNASIKIVEAGVNKIINALNSVTDFVGAGTINAVSLGQITNKAEGGARNLGKTVGDGFLQGFNQNAIETTVVGLLDKADKAAEKRIAEQKALQDRLDAERGNLLVAQAGGTTPFDNGKKKNKPTFSGLFSELEIETELLRLNNREREIRSGLLSFESQLQRPLSGQESSLVEDQLRLNQGLVDDEILGDYLKQFQDEAELLSLSNREREIRFNLLGLESQLQRQLTAEESSRFEQQLRTNQLLADQATLYDEINAPLNNYEQGLTALNSLLEAGRINLDQYKNKLDELRLAYLETQTDLASGVERAFLKVAQEASNAAAQIEQVITNAFQKAEDVFVEFTKTGKLNFGDLVNSIVEDLTRLAFKQLITAPLAGALGLGASGAGGAGLLGGVGSLFGFANGGEFKVGGTGGTDSQLVAFKASPDETVTVTKPGQSRGGGDTYVINIQTQDAESFQRSGSQIMSQFAQNLARTKKRYT